MSQLSDQILLLNHQYGIEFNQTYPTATVTGTNAPTSGTIFSLVGTAPVHAPGVGPLGGSGSWKWTQTAGQTQTNVRTSSTNLPSTWMDGDYSTGIWFMLDAIPNSNGTHTFHALFPQSSSVGFSVGIRGSNNATNPGKLYSNITTSSNNGFGPVINAGQWYYIAHRKNTTANTVEIYLNGSLVFSGSNTLTGANNSAYFGPTLTNSGTNTINYYLSNWYVGTYSAIGPTQIADVWNAGSTAPTTLVTATPLTASADQVDATIVVTGGSFTEVTTSITVDATFPDNIAVVAERNLNIEIIGTLDASATIGDNVQAGGVISDSFSASEFIASVELVEPILARQAMVASATIADPSVYVDPSYFNLVKQSNPLVYCQFDATTFINDGSVTFTQSTNVDSTVIKNVASGNSMGLVGSGKSWKFNSKFATSFEISNFTDLGNLNGDYTIEYWFKPTAVNAGAGVKFSNIQVGYLKNNSTMYVNIGGTLPTWDGTLYGVPSYSSQRYIKAQDNLIVTNEWNHIVVRVESATSSGSVQLFVNGNIAGSLNVSWDISNMAYDGFFFFDSDADRFIGPGTLNRGWYAEEDQGATGSLVDQFAIYGTPLSYSTIIDHYSFINSLSPDATITSTPLTISANSGNHAFVVTSNAIPEIKEATASAYILEPDVMGGKSKTVVSDEMIAAATLVIPSVSYGITTSPDPMVSYAESANAFALNTVYFDYVQANIAPYRYVTFDGSNSYLDYGSDNDYSVAAVSGGTIVSPEFGINGKSAKIDGITYTDGVVLKESEWNDTWGTGQNTYHSSFWMQKADDDVSTGLRVLWNLNGYLDNQHVILFQYQGKLHMQFNNGSGTHLDTVTTNNIDLFDGDRHFVVIAFDHTNNNDNKAHLYVDSVLVLTANLGSYNGQTVNGTSYVGPNDEANNHPRLGVGCLITPFAQTALPVVPTNIKIYVDEIIWAKSAATQNVVNGLYAAMPDKQNELVTTEEMHADSVMIAPAISTSVNILASSLTAGIIIVEAEVTADREVVVIANTLIASAILAEALRSDGVTIVSDIMLASGSVNGADVKITIPGGPMLAQSTLVEPKVNGFNLNLTLSAWARYLRATDVYSLSVQRGVK